MDRIVLKEVLSNNDLEKLNSMEGIIELLCDIPNFNMGIYEELDENKLSLVDYTLGIKLLTDSQIESNLRRSMDNDCLALINEKKLIALSLLYFGVKDENNRYVGYICPYTGKYYNLLDMSYELRKSYKERDKDKILELEHIIPHSSYGGTVLFNCIPSSKEANGITEKSDLHLLDWYNQSGSKYYDKERLYNLVSYILSAYSISFKEYQETELDYYESDINNELETDNDELENIKEHKEKIKNVKHVPIEGYIPFLKQLINKLETDGYDVSIFNNKLVELENNNIINDINKYEIVQDVIEKLFKEYAVSENTSYLTYSLNIDYIKLVNSINSSEKDEIEVILRTRVSNIKYLVDINNKTMNDYFISLRDIQELDILYKENPTEEEIQAFVENIKLSHDTKINVFIKMLTDKKYTSYEEGKANSNNIFRQLNKIPFEGYESIEGLNTASFWNSNSHKILERLDYLESNSKSNEEVEKYKIARRSIEEYEFVNNMEKKIDKFIEMLADKKYTSYEDGKVNKDNIFSERNKIPFKGYESIEGLNTAFFWNNNSYKILERLDYLESNSKSNEEVEKYKIARRSIEEYEFITKLEKKIDKFIEMLADKKYTSYEEGKVNKNNLFSRNKIPFKGYENIEGLNTAYFWSGNSPKILERLDYLESNSKSNEEIEKYKIARRSIEEYEFITKLEKRIDKFIEMLIDKQYTSYEGGVANSNNVFRRNRIPFKGYESIDGLNTASFWSGNSPEILERLDYLESNSKSNEEIEKYKIARRSIEEYEFITKLEKRIDKFIEMLTDKQYTSYVEGKPNSNNIFSRNKIPFKGYENIEGLNTGQFWKNNSQDYIIPLLFYNKYYASKQNKYIDSDKDYSGHEYDNARKNILEYLKVDNINDYINKLNEKEKKTKQVQNLIDLRDSLKNEGIRLIQYEQGLIKENIELKETINMTTRRAM